MSAKMQQGQAYVIHILPSWVLMGTVQAVHEDPSGRVHYEVAEAVWIERCTDTTKLTTAKNFGQQTFPSLWTRPISDGAPIVVDDAVVSMAWPAHKIPTERIDR
jgi:hypothetical protein